MKQDKEREGQDIDDVGGGGAGTGARGSVK